MLKRNAIPLSFGEASIVSSINESLFREAMEEKGVYLPTPGMLVVAINNEPLYKAGSERTQIMLNELGTTIKREHIK